MAKFEVISKYISDGKTDITLPVRKTEEAAGYDFVVAEDTIIPPFNAIDGLGDVVAKNIEAEAKKHPFISIEDFQNRCKVSSTLIEKMKTMGLFKDMPETSQLTLF